MPCSAQVRLDGLRGQTLPAPRTAWRSSQKLQNQLGQDTRHRKPRRAVGAGCPTGMGSLWPPIPIWWNGDQGAGSSETQKNCAIWLHLAFFFANSSRRISESIFFLQCTPVRLGNSLSNVPNSQLQAVVPEEVSPLPGKRTGGLGRPCLPCFSRGAHSTAVPSLGLPAQHGPQLAEKMPPPVLAY